MAWLSQTITKNGKKKNKLDVNYDSKVRKETCRIETKFVHRQRDIASRELKPRSECPRRCVKHARRREKAAVPRGASPTDAYGPAPRAKTPDRNGTAPRHSYSFLSPPPLPPTPHSPLLHNEKMFHVSSGKRGSDSFLIIFIRV